MLAFQLATVQTQATLNKQVIQMKNIQVSAVIYEMLNEIARRHRKSAKQILEQLIKDTYTNQ